MASLLSSSYKSSQDHPSQEHSNFASHPLLPQKPLLIAYCSLKDLALINPDDLQAIDVINLAFAHVKEASLHFDPPADLIKELARLRRQKEDLRIVLSVGGWSSGGFSEMASSEKKRACFCQSSLDTLQQYELDGLDIDWEYPGFRVAGIGASPEDHIFFTALLQDLRHTLGDQRILSIAAGGDRYFVKNTDVADYVPFLDYIQLMTYDLRGGFSIVTGHHSNLYAPKGDLSDASCDTAVKAFLAASCPSEKLVLGAAYYAREWKLNSVSSPEESYGVMCASTGGYGPSLDELLELEQSAAYVKCHDGCASASWLYGEGRFISYDDRESLKAKCSYVKNQKLRGLMFWEYGLGAKCHMTRQLGEWLSENFSI